MAKDLTDALHQLTEEAAGRTTRKDNSLPAGRGTNAIPDRVGSAKPVAKPSSGGGIASPLTETTYASRTYWANVTITSTDGFITLALAPIKRVNFTDANGNAVAIDYKSP